jgi:hypothetical protein
MGDAGDDAAEAVGVDDLGLLAKRHGLLRGRAAGVGRTGCTIAAPAGPARRPGAGRLAATRPPPGTPESGPTGPVRTASTPRKGRKTSNSGLWRDWVWRLDCETLHNHGSGAPSIVHRIPRAVLPLLVLLAAIAHPASAQIAMPTGVALSPFAVQQSPSRRSRSPMASAARGPSSRARARTTVCGSTTSTPTARTAHDSTPRPARSRCPTRR